MNLETIDAITLTDFEPTAADFRAEFLDGIRRRPRLLPCKFFYDERGSRLFDHICELPEYYPTRTELGILTTHRSAIAELCGPQCLLVELGSGSSTKTRLLLDELHDPAAYIPIDISKPHLRRATSTLAKEYPGLEILPVCADYAQPLHLPSPAVSPRRTVVFFPGSTIGNFEPDSAVRFLRRVAMWCGPGDGLLIGIDFEKSRDLLLPAYNDASGVTAAFNLNLLRRANEELGANFALDQFSHEAIYAEDQGRIEMHLVSRCAQRVEIGPERIAFRRGERIVTEYSYKYRPDHFVSLAQRAGWTASACWTDSRGWFGVLAFERAHWIG